MIREEHFSRLRPRRPGQTDDAGFVGRESPYFASAQTARHTPAPVDIDQVFAVIPCLNEAEHIERLLAHLLNDKAWTDPLVVVADGGSTDGTVEIVQRIAAADPRVRFIENLKRRQSAGINLAVARFGRDRRWMVRVDAHAGYPENYVSRLLAEGLKHKAASVVVCMRTIGRGGFQSAAAAAQNSRLGAGGAAHRCGGEAGWVDHGHHALFDLEYYLAVGGYNETFLANEDAELDIRLGKVGAGIWLSSEVQIDYYPRSTPSALLRQYFQYGKGRARTLLLHRVRPKLRQMIPVAVAPAVLIALLGPLYPPLALPALIWTLLSLSIGVTLALRSKGAALAGPGIAAMVMHLGWSMGFWSQLLSLRPAARAQPRAFPEGAL